MHSLRQYFGQGTDAQYIQQLQSSTSPLLSVTLQISGKQTKTVCE